MTEKFPAVKITSPKKSSATLTRMHSSRMRTGRSLTVFRSLLFLGGWGVSGPGGVWSWGVWSRGVWSRGVWSQRGLVPGGSGPGGVWSWGVSGRGGSAGQVPPPVNRMTNRCKNITLAKTSFRPVTSQFKDSSTNTIINTSVVRVVVSHTRGSQNEFHQRELFTVGFFFVITYESL